MFSKHMKKTAMKLSMMVAVLALALPFQVIGAQAATATTAVDGASFQYIVTMRKHFGDNPEWHSGIVFEGGEADYTFSASDVNPNARAVLMLRTYGVGNNHNVLKINGKQLAHGLVAHSVEEEWVTQIVEVDPGLLKASGNILRIEARDANGGQANGQLDDFVIDSVVLMYKTN